ncbi:MAG: VCBS repeat-containing protein [Planctomycetes bacterium]|nr:VCBS repeat-containing protein [Planctomycetota bacterium]
MRRTWVFPVAAALLSPAGCRSWDDVRRDFVDPVNLTLHVKLPRAWTSMVLDDILAFYSPALASDPVFRRRKEDLLGRFVNLEQAACILDGLVQEAGGKRFTTRALLRLRGTAPGERGLVLEHWYALACEEAEGRWRIASETLLSERMALGREPAFTEEAEARGVIFTHASGGVVDRHGVRRNYSAGSGLAVGDPNDDGHEDIYLVSGKGGRLFLSKGDGTFADATLEAKLDAPFEGEGRSAVFADYDSDGHTDLFVALLDAPNRLYRNRGDGTFEDAAGRAGLVPCNETVGAAFADFNRDGHLDLYLVNGGNLLRKHPDPIYNALNATPNVLYISNGDGTFTDRTAEAGVGHPGWALAVSTADYDLDGDTDIFVGNDVGLSLLFRNRGDATFDDVTLEAGVKYRGSTMNAAWGDVNNDGYPEIFAAAMDSNSRWMIDQPGFPSPAPWYVNLFLRPVVLGILKEMLHGNRFYVSNGDGTFAEAAEVAGVRRNGWAWSGHFLDYDQDGFLDIYCVNGFLSGPERQDL